MTTFGPTSRHTLETFAAATSATSSAVRHTMTSTALLGSTMYPFVLGRGQVHKRFSQVAAQWYQVVTTPGENPPLKRCTLRGRGVAFHHGSRSCERDLGTGQSGPY